MQTLNFEQGEDLRYRFVDLPYHATPEFETTNTEGFDLIAGLSAFGRDYGYSLGELVTRRFKNPLWAAYADQPKQEKKYSDWFEAIPEDFNDL